MIMMNESIIKNDRIYLSNQYNNLRKSRFCIDCKIFLTNENSINLFLGKYEFNFAICFDCLYKRVKKHV